MQKNLKNHPQASSASRANDYLALQQQQMMQHHLHLDTLKSLTDLYNATKPLPSEDQNSLNIKVSQAIDNLLTPFLPTQPDLNALQEYLNAADTPNATE